MNDDDRPIGKVLSRRELLILFGATALSPLVLRAPRVHSLSSELSVFAGEAPAPGSLPSCVVRPEQTEGPYFAEERMRRSDIRSEPSNGKIEPGLPLSLILLVSKISGNSCKPLPNAIVDIWQCNAAGVYSDFRDFGGLFDATGKKFLRGYQLTDAGGKAEFLTIYPGFYPGRTVHIHFKIRTSPEAKQSQEFTSQLYFDDSITDLVYKTPPYSERNERRTRNDSDGIFSDGGKDLMLVLKKDGQGYTGTFEIGLLT